MNHLLKKTIFIFLLSFIIFSACKKDEIATCSIDDPLETIEWLKAIKFTFETSAQPNATKIVQYEYNGECVFWIENCVNCPDASIEVYNEVKDLICQFGTIAGLNTCPGFLDDATGEVILWSN